MLGGFEPEAVYQNADISVGADTLPPRPSLPSRGQVLLLGAGSVDDAEHVADRGGQPAVAPVTEDIVYGNMRHGFDDTGDDMP